MKKSRIALGVLAGTLVFTGLTRSAKADNVAIVRTPLVGERVESTGPNRTLLHSGIWIFGLSYLPAVIVATESERHGDKNLYVPVAGPWMDLATRSGCPANETCNNETVNKVLIIVDGVFQALGALDFVGAFVFSETRTVTVGSLERGHVGELSPSLRVVPTQVAGSAYGLSAIGTF